MRRATYLLVVSCALIFVMTSCRTLENAVPYREITKAEVSVELPKAVVFRIDYLPSSFAGIGDYLFLAEKADTGSKYYLSVFRDRKQRKQGIVEDVERGAQITIPVTDVSVDHDTFWYRDAEGSYKIPFGTQASWDQYIQSKTR